MGAIDFGTDCWRVVIADEVTVANVERNAQATAAYGLANAVAWSDQMVKGDTIAEVG